MLSPDTRIVCGHFIDKSRYLDYIIIAIFTTIYSQGDDGMERMGKGIGLIRWIKQRPADDYIVCTLMLSMVALSISYGCQVIVCTEWGEILSIVFAILWVLMLVLTEILVILVPKDKFLRDAAIQEPDTGSAIEEDTPAGN